MTSEAKIIIAVKDGKVVTRVILKNLSQPDLGMLLSDLELMRLDLLSKYKLNVRKFNNDGTF